MIKSFKELKKLKQEGKVKELPNKQEVLEVNLDTTKTTVEAKDAYEQFKILYKEKIDEKCLADYGSIEDKNLWEDIAKELFISIENYIPSEEDKSEKIEESISLTERVTKELINKLDNNTFSDIYYFSTHIDDIEKVIDNCTDKSKCKEYKEILKAARAFARGREEAHKETKLKEAKITDYIPERELLDIVKSNDLFGFAEAVEALDGMIIKVKNNSGYSLYKLTKNDDGNYEAQLINDEGKNLADPFLLIESKFLKEDKEPETKEEIKNRIRDINSQLAYCRRRDRVCMALDGDTEVTELQAERDELRKRLKDAPDTKIEEDKEIVTESYTARERFEAHLEKYDSEKQARIKVLAETENYILTGVKNEKGIYLDLTSGYNRDKMYPEVYIDQETGKGIVTSTQINWSAYGSCTIEETEVFQSSLQEAIDFCKSIEGVNFSDKLDESKLIEAPDSREINSIVVSYTSNQNYIKYYNLTTPISKVEVDDIKNQIKNKEMYISDIADKLGAVEVKYRKELVPDTYIMKIREDNDELDENKEIINESQVSEYTLQELSKVIKDEGNDYKLQITGSDTKTKWLNLDKEDLKAMYSAFQNKNVKTESMD